MMSCDSQGQGVKDIEASALNSIGALALGEVIYNVMGTFMQPCEEIQITSQ